MQREQNTKKEEKMRFLPLNLPSLLPGYLIMPQQMDKLDHHAQHQYALLKLTAAVHQLHSLVHTSLQHLKISALTQPVCYTLTVSEENTITSAATPLNLL